VPEIVNISLNLLKLFTEDYGSFLWTQCIYVYIHESNSSTAFAKWQQEWLGVDPTNLRFP